MLRRLPTVEFRDAHISPCGTWRYWLERRWNGAGVDAPMVVWCGLNPSKADAKRDDPTIRRMMGFTEGWGFSRFVVLNLYAYRATDPRELDGLTLDQLQGPAQHLQLTHWLTDANTRIVVCCWGAGRFKCVPIPYAITATPRYALGLTASGEPKHPLYLPANSTLTRI